MTWRETLEGLKDELTNTRARRQSRVDEEAASLQKEREDLSNRAQQLGINELLAEMNNTLLDGNGAIETIVGWVTADDDLELEPGISMNGEEPDEDDATDNIHPQSLRRKSGHRCLGPRSQMQATPAPR